MDLGIRDQVAVVTGGATGIGRAIVEALADEGACVAIWDIATGARAARSEVIGTSTRPILAVTTDVADDESVKQAATQTVGELGPIEHLVHGAAVGSGKYGFPFTNLDPADWRRVLEVNVMGMVHVAHAVAPGMRLRQSGTMTFLASVAGQIGSQTDPPYSASKAANINFAQCLARDLAPHGIRVNTVCPGMVKTSLSQSVWEAWRQRPAAHADLSYDQWGDEKVRRLVPLGNWQRPQDIADMVLFLTSKRAAQVTGQTINVDGGYVMHG
jgi:2-hydroxycyclohexanecarboxyl-CoA dehydrogenase